MSEHYEATVEVAGHGPPFTYTLKVPSPASLNLGNLTFEEYVWFSMLIALENSNDMSDRYVKRETLTVDLVRVTTTREKIL